jgi:hypothetical protein
VTPPGHLAVAYLLARRGVVARGLWHAAPVWLGALLPDLADKSLQWLKLTPYGRTVGHSVLVWLALAVAWRLVAPRVLPKTASASGLVILGGFSHLAIDLVDDLVEGVERTGYVFSAWFGWPFTNPDMWNAKCPHLFAPLPHAVTTLELATVATCLLHVAGTRRARSSARLSPAHGSAR